MFVADRHIPFRKFLMFCDLYACFMVKDFYFLGVYLCFACEFWFGFMGVIWVLGDSCWVGVGPLIRCP